MSELPPEEPDDVARAGASPSRDVAPGDAPLDERPPVAGGTDDDPPAQGEGAPDSW
jgi:hypothetical protein